MKHNAKITAILLSMFVITQIIGLVLINAYTPQQKLILNESGQYENITVSPNLPEPLQPPQIEPEVSLTSLIIAMVIAILIIFLLMKINATILLRIWFFAVVAIAIAITLNPIFTFTQLSFYIALIIAVPLAVFKVFKRNILVHNITELMIYPGIAVIFVSILNVWAIIVFLVLISIYDAWAVWHSKIMQKMAKFQMNNLKFFAGFFVPYIPKEEREKLKKLRKEKSKKGRVKVALAILGGGDVVFPIITAGVFLRTYGLIPALLVVLGATLALGLLFILSEKKKFYPAMPFITAGIFLGMFASLFFI